MPHDVKRKEIRASAEGRKEADYVAVIRFYIANRWPPPTCRQSPARQAPSRILGKGLSGFLLGFCWSAWIERRPISSSSQDSFCSNQISGAKLIVFGSDPKSAQVSKHLKWAYSHSQVIRSESHLAPSETLANRYPRCLNQQPTSNYSHPYVSYQVSVSCRRRRVKDDDAHCLIGVWWAKNSSMELRNSLSSVEQKCIRFYCPSLISLYMCYRSIDRSFDLVSIKV